MQGRSACSRARSRHLREYLYRKRFVFSALWKQASAQLMDMKTTLPSSIPFFMSYHRKGSLYDETPLKGTNFRVFHASYPIPKYSRLRKNVGQLTHGHGLCCTHAGQLTLLSRVSHVSTPLDSARFGSGIALCPRSSWVQTLRPKMIFNRIGVSSCHYH